MFADDLREQLKANHMTQKDLAEYLGVKQCSVSHWLKGLCQPRDRAFDMIIELFEMKREHYTAERAGIVKKKEKPKKEVPKEGNSKVIGAFNPKPYVRPEVKERVDLSENPYKKKEKNEEPYRCDLEIMDIKKNFVGLKEETDKKFDNVARLLHEQDGTNHYFADTMKEIDDRIAELEEKIVYLRGMIDGAYTDKPELESKSWWQRLWS